MNWFNVITWNCSAVIGLAGYYIHKDVAWLTMGVSCFLASIVMFTYEKRIDILENRS